MARSSRRHAWAWAALAAGCAGAGPPRAGPQRLASPLRAPPAHDAGGHAPAGAAPGDGASSAEIPGGAIGTAHPTIVEAAAPDARWVVVCQARADSNGDGQISVGLGPHGAPSGDALGVHLIRGDGHGEPIDALLAHDPQGRWLVVQRDRRVLLLDMHGTGETDLDTLGADARDDARSFMPHRALAFDASGEHLAYLRRSERGWNVVVRVLRSAEETALDPGPGEPWRIEIDASGRWLVARMLVDDTDGNGRLDWPVPAAPPGWRRCAGPIARFSAWAQRGDRPVTRVIPLRGGAARTLPGFVAALGTTLIEREPGGRLLLVGEHAPSELSPSGCGGRLLHADARRSLVVLACAGAKPGRAQVEIAGPGLRVPLAAEVAAPSGDTESAAPPGSPSAPRLLPLYPGSDAGLIDLDRHALDALSPGDRVLAIGSARALLRRGDALVLHEPGAGSTTLAAPVGPGAEVLVTQPVAAVGPFVADLERAVLLGTLPSRPLALARSGHALLALGGDPDATRLAVGPLVWRAPEQPPAAGAGSAGH